MDSEYISVGEVAKFKRQFVIHQLGVKMGIAHPFLRPLVHTAYLTGI